MKIYSYESKKMATQHQPGTVWMFVLKLGIEYWAFTAQIPRIEAFDCARYSGLVFGLSIRLGRFNYGELFPNVQPQTLLGTDARRASLPHLERQTK
jgi:hypothetical protein